MLNKLGVAAVAAAQEYYGDVATPPAMVNQLLDDLFEEFGEPARHIAEAASDSLLESIRAEEKRMADGWTYEPPTFYEVNAACRAKFAGEYAGAGLCEHVESTSVAERPPSALCKDQIAPTPPSERSA
jgi:hypothetical protein